MTVTVFPLAAESVTLKSISSPSSAAAPATLTVGGLSSLLMVPVPIASVMVALDGLDSVTVKVSSSSSVLSSLVPIEAVIEVSPGEKVSVPLVVPLRSPDTAAVLPVPNDVA